MAHTSPIKGTRKVLVSATEVLVPGRLHEADLGDLCLTRKVRHGLGVGI